jgi:uncharacterized membrane protein YraQ (UPF0718 family)
MGFLIQVLMEAWKLFLSSAIYVIFGMMAAGLLRVFFNPSTVAHHLGRGRFLSVVKAALFGIPIPL